VGRVWDAFNGVLPCKRQPRWAVPELPPSRPLDSPGRAKDAVVAARKSAGMGTTARPMHPPGGTGSGWRSLRSTAWPKPWPPHCGGTARSAGWEPHCP
jgi:hypothetical protein